MTQSTLDQIAGDGYAVVDEILPPTKLQALTEAIEDACAKAGGSVHGLRNLLDLPAIREIANGSYLQAFVAQMLGGEPFCVRGIYFDKPQEANWSVPWHQDLAIAVAERIDTPGFGGWSVKQGIVHVQPPAEILERMITVRIHLDPCDSENGPLYVSPGTHLLGRIPEGEIAEIVRQNGSQVCEVRKGGAVLMKPLILHSSPTSRSAQPRRVVHLEYACAPLPGGLRWHAETVFTEN